MPRISNRYLHKDIEQYLCDILWDYLAALNNRESVREFVDSILSSTEQIMIAKRLAIAVLISRGYTFEIIDDKLKVSKATIAGVHHQLQSGAVGYKKAVEHIEKKRDSAQKGDSIEEFLLKLIPPAAPGSNRFLVKSSVGKTLYRNRKRREVI